MLFKTMNVDFAKLEKELIKKVSTVASNEDPPHDLLHFKRVVRAAKLLCVNENAKLEVVIPAAWLHDLVIISKSDSRRNQASRLSAEAAIEYLKQIQYPEIYFDEIAHAITAHSFSANITPLTIEAKIVQDADRLDALGAIGIARCFATAGLMKTSFYSEEDAFCKQRAPNDKEFTIDHFFVKLFGIAETLKTESGRHEGQKRVAVMKTYLSALELEI